MGQNVSVSEEERNELYNIFQLNPEQQSQKITQTHSVVMMRMMAPTALGVKPRVAQPPLPPRKQRVRKPATKVRRAQRAG